MTLWKVIHISEHGHKMARRVCRSLSAFAEGEGVFAKQSHLTAISGLPDLVQLACAWLGEHEENARPLSDPKRATIHREFSVMALQVEQVDGLVNGAGWDQHMFVTSRQRYDEPTALEYPVD